MRTHFIEPTLATLHGHFSRELPAILTIDPGDHVVFKTLDVHWGEFEQSDPFAPASPLPGRDVERDPGHALCGPIAITGARAGMTLEVRIVSIRTGRWGYTGAGGYPSAVNTRLGIGEPPRVDSRWALDPHAQLARDKQGRTVRLRPFMGVLGMPPAEPGRHPTTPPRSCGGNIDCRELVAGTTLYLPIPVDGALFSAGDGHAVQGDGEVAGPALECPVERAELEFHLRPDLTLVRPRAWTPTHEITFGFDEDLDEAMAIALSDMLELLGERLGCDRRTAMAFASLVVDLRITQIVNGVRGVHAMVEHEALARLAIGTAR